MRTFKLAPEEGNLSLQGNIGPLAPNPKLPATANSYNNSLDFCWFCWFDINLHACLQSYILLLIQTSFLIS